MAKADPNKSDTPNTDDAPLTQKDFLAVVKELIATRGIDQAQGLGPNELREILSGVTAATQKAMRPENATAPNVSAFNPNGGEKTPLQFTDADGQVKPRATYFCGGRQREEMLTPLEIELFNKITTSKEARNGAWTAKVIRNGGDQELHVTVPTDRDRRMELPSLPLILMELIGGKEAADPLSLIARVEALEARNRVLEAAVA